MRGRADGDAMTRAQSEYRTALVAPAIAKRTARDLAYADAMLAERDK